MMQSVIVAVIGITVVVCLSHFTSSKKEGWEYNCSIAEISPDYPTEVKQGCRKLRMENIK